MQANDNHSHYWVNIADTADALLSLHTPAANPPIMSAPFATLTELLIQERNSLLRHLDRYLDRASSEDTYQAMYCKLATLAGEPGIADKRSYLFRIASNLAIDHLRQHRRRTDFEATAVLAQPACASDTAKIAASRQEIARIAQAMEHLPLRTRQIFVLNRYDGLSHSLIAKRLGISTTTVENHIRQALNCLSRARDGESSPPPA